MARQEGMSGIIGASASGMIGTLWADRCRITSKRRNFHIYIL